MTQTLPQALLLQAETRGSAIALRYKRLGIWHVRSWSELALLFWHPRATGYAQIAYLDN